MAIDRFPQFNSPRLPPEIQDLVWERAVANIEPRIVELRSESPQLQFDTDEAEIICTSPTPIPALLHVCSRSRYLSQRRWNLTFRETETYQRYGWFATSPPVPKVWFDHERDILLLLDSASILIGAMDFYQSRTNLIQSERAEVRNLAVNLDDILREAENEPFRHSGDWEGDPNSFNIVEVANEMHRTYPGVKKLYIVLNGASHDRHHDFIKDQAIWTEEGHERVEELFKQKFEEEGWGSLEIEFTKLVDNRPRLA